MEERTLSDRYQLIAHLARGGMADVYEAEDRLLNRRVAIKILHPNFAADEAFVTRFRREAQAAANLSHPNIVAIYDWGQDGDTYFMVMELIDGRTLRDIMKSEGALLPRRAAEIAAEAAAALEVAHQAGVYHRDIKPGNIMIANDGGVKVTDFGIARALDDSEELTKTGAVIGTATYFSPEQAQGMPADGRSDIYSLGVVLYEMLAGRPPFTGESPVAVAYQHVSEYAPTPIEVSPEVPLAASAVVEAAMAKNPEDRYQTAAEFRSDLLAYLSGREPAVVGAIPAAAATALINAPPATAAPDETARAVAYPPPPEPSGGTATYLAAVAALVALLAIGGWILFQMLTGAGVAAPQTVVVPDVTLIPVEEAFDELQALDLKVTQRAEVNDAIPAGIVISTEPPAGTEVDVGTTVTVVVSAGSELFGVPSVVGETLDVAIALIEAQGFEVGEITYTLTEDIAEDIVIDQSPEEGTPAEAGTEVDLEVSRGPFSLEIPDVTGLTANEALLELARVGFEDVSTEEEFSADFPEGFVTRTDPEVGRVVSRDLPIVVYVSAGPEPIEVPDVQGMTLANASTALRAVGLVPVRGEDIEVTDQALVGVVAAQSPAAAQVIPEGSEVTLRIGVILQVTVPNFQKMSLVQAQQAAAAVGLSVVRGQDVEVTDPSLVGVIAQQNPASGATANYGSTVTVRFGVIKKVTVPNFHGMSIAEAQQAAAAVGLTIVQGPDIVVGDPDDVGVIAAQNPSAGATADYGSAVTVRIGIMTTTT